MTTIQTLPVLFRAERSGQFKGEITAVFPTLAFDYAGREFMVYDSDCGHGGARLAWYRTTRAARPDEFADLLRELRGIYETRPAARPDIYGEPVRLEVRQRFSLAMRRAWQANARAHRDALRADPAGGPWSPDARAETAAAMAADERESVS